MSASAVGQAEIFVLVTTASENRLIVCPQVLSQDKLTEAEVAQGGPALLIPDGMGGC